MSLSFMVIRLYFKIDYSTTKHIEDFDIYINGKKIVKRTKLHLFVLLIPSFMLPQTYYF